MPISLSRADRPEQASGLAHARVPECARWCAVASGSAPAVYMNERNRTRVSGLSAQSATPGSRGSVARFVRAYFSL